MAMAGGTVSDTLAGMVFFFFFLCALWFFQFLSFCNSLPAQCVFTKKKERRSRKKGAGIVGPSGVRSRETDWGARKCLRGPCHCTKRLFFALGSSASGLFILNPAFFPFFLFLLLGRGQRQVRLCIVDLDGGNANRGRGRKGSGRGAGQVLLSPSSFDKRLALPSSRLALRVFLLARGGQGTLRNPPFGEKKPGLRLLQHRERQAAPRLNSL